MGEHQMPPAQRLRPREQDLRRPICHVRRSCRSRIQIRQKNERSVETQGPHYYYCCYDTPNVSVTHSKTRVVHTWRNIEHDLFWWLVHPWLTKPKNLRRPVAGFESNRKIMIISIVIQRKISENLLRHLFTSHLRCRAASVKVTRFFLSDPS